MSYSDFDEDDWFASLFPAGYVGHAVEVGGYNGEQSSNTLALEKAGWTVLVVEPNPQFEPAIKAARKCYWMGAASDHEAFDEAFYVNKLNPGSFSALRPTLNHPVTRPGEADTEWRILRVQVATLDSLLARFEFPRLDALSIDTEGTELDVLKGINLAHWQPKAIVCEAWSEPSDSHEYLIAQGYTRIERRHVNNLYLR